MSQPVVICQDCHQPLSLHTCPDVFTDAAARLATRGMELERDAKDFAMMTKRLSAALREATAGARRTHAVGQASLSDLADDLVKRKGYSNLLRNEPPTDPCPQT